MSYPNISFETKEINKEIAIEILRKYQNVTYNWVNTDGKFHHASVDLLMGRYGITLEKEGEANKITEVQNLTDAVDIFLEFIRESQG